MQIINATNDIRLNKALADAGLCSRREADTYIQQSKVKVNGKRGLLGQKVFAGDKIEFIAETKDLRYALYYKPKGEVTGLKDKELLVGLHPVGRLDKDSEGLLIYTNDHTIVDYLLNPESKIEKEYVVQVREKATPRVERILLAGITTQEQKYNPVKRVTINDEGHVINIVITEGKKHEIRRMLNALNLTIVNLKRVRIQNIRLARMFSGQAKSLTLADIKK